MKSIRNIVVIAVLCIICSTISMYATNQTGTGTVNLSVVPTLTITVYPPTPTPQNGLIPKVGRGDVMHPSNLYIEYMVLGGNGMMVNLSHNGSGVETVGTGVTLTTNWTFDLNGWTFGYPMTQPITTPVPLDETYGNLFLRCYIATIAATTTATLGLHQTQLILTASYYY